MPTTAPPSTYILVVGIMATFASFGIVLIFTPPWYWFMIPVALALPEVVILLRRAAARHRLRQSLRESIRGIGY